MGCKGHDCGGAQFQRLEFLAALPLALAPALNCLALSFFALAFSALLILLLACKSGIAHISEKAAKPTTPCNVGPAG